MTTYKGLIAASDAQEIPGGRDGIERGAAVWRAPEGSLVKLVAAAGLDPARDFRSGDFREWPLQDEDVRGFDFTGSDLRGSGIEFAIRDETTILTNAILDHPLPSSPSSISLQSRTRHKARGRELSVTLLGATGSIGASTIDLMRMQRDRFRVEAVTAQRNAGALARLARDLGAKFAVVSDPGCYGELKEALAGTGIEAAAGAGAVVEAAERPADWVMATITGAAGLRPTMTAIERGATVALANKECLVCAGRLFMQRAAATGATVLPVDSVHNAIFQALSAGRRGDVSRIILTASGGPFRTASLAEMRAATVQQALRHPNWSMGAKVTIDSATMMNKGLELIEAHHLFGFGSDQIDIVVHPQSIVHGIVEYRDGSMIAQLGPPDMRVPIANCLAWPERMAGAARLDFRQTATLTFEPPDPVRFPALALAREALVAQNGAPTVLNAANEIAVQEFIAGRLGFAGIAALVKATIENAQGRGITREPVDVDDAIAVDHNSRSLAQSLLPEIAAKAIAS